MTEEQHAAIIAALPRNSAISIRVYEVIRGYAEKGAPCPSNKEICNILGYQGHPSNISCCLNTLHRRGLITLLSEGWCRQVTILLTGESTRPIPPNGKKRDRKTAGEYDASLRGTMSPLEWCVHVEEIVQRKVANGGRGF